MDCIAHGVARSQTRLSHFHQVVPRGALSCCQRSRDPARIETRFVPTALQLAGALDLPAGSCTFEENTCGFDSVFEFLPWILNEEGKGLVHRGPT